jgi:hypothetical protein
MSRLEPKASMKPPRAADRAVEAGDLDKASCAQIEGEEAPRAPWHFKVLLVGTAGYLVYRLIWFIFWLTGHAWHG